MFQRSFYHFAPEASPPGGSLPDSTGFVSGDGWSLRSCISTQPPGMLLLQVRATLCLVNNMCHFHLRQVHGRPLTERIALGVSPEQGLVVVDRLAGHVALGG